jgi:hypothetical protein
LGLLISYQQTKDPIYLEAAIKWYDFLINKTGFEKYEDSLYVNYFAFSSQGIKVPNNTTLVMWFFAELFKATGDRKFLKLNNKLIRFLELCQKPSGELIYRVGKEHYLCYQYNSFEFIDLFNCYEITGDIRIKTIMKKLAKYIASGVTEKGSVKLSCSQTYPEYIHFSGAAGAALINATNIGLGNYNKHIERLYCYLIENQQSNGSFFFSTNDMIYVTKPIQWGFLTDKIAYTRPMSYILNQLLFGIESNIKVNRL